MYALTGLIYLIDISDKTYLKLRRISTGIDITE